MIKANDIKMDLINQLEIKNVYGNQYLDLINDYMSMRGIKDELIIDIERRGVSVRWDNGGGQGGYKKNDSIGELNKTNAQMLRILNELGLKANKREVVDQDGEM